MQYVFDYIKETSDECQFSMTQLIEIIKGNHIPDWRTIKMHLEDKYGNDVVISNYKNLPPIVSFRTAADKILSESWYAKKRDNELN